MSTPTSALVQPIQTNITLADGIFAKHILIQKAETWVPQHAHAWDHITLVSAGAIAVYRDDIYVGIFAAPKGLVIPANTKHAFQTLSDNTVISCIHRIDRTGEVDVVEEHQF